MKTREGDSVRLRGAGEKLVIEQSELLLALKLGHAVLSCETLPLDGFHAGQDVATDFGPFCVSNE